jgi:3D (Asp-Asp-Asp) domain-containing protein
MLVQALDNPLQRARLTGYSSRCPDGGGPRTRWGSKVRPGICAADPRYWGPGSVIWVGDPIREILVVEDTGGAIKGPHRFDVCTGDDPVAARRIGRRDANYVVLHRVPPQRSWGSRPADWHPPVLAGDPE